MIILNDSQIQDSCDQRKLVAALQRAFQFPGKAPPRMHGDLPGEDHAKLLVMPCWAGRESLGVKIVTVIPSNADRGKPTVDGVYILMDGQTGEPLAVLSARSLTALRTAGVCALAASLLSRQDAKVLLMVGTGALASHLIKAYLAARNLERVIVWGRQFDKAQELAARLSGLPVVIEAARDLPTVLGSADIISSATASREPLIEGHRVARGTHVDLIGSFTPEMREADSELFRRGRLIVDSAMAFEESGDLLAPLRDGVINHEAPDLTRLLHSPGLGRQSVDEITLFKTVGTGLADLAAARLIYSEVSKLRVSATPL